jgi:hypothetical protein
MGKAAVGSMPDNGASSADASSGALGGASKADLARGFIPVPDEEQLEAGGFEDWGDSDMPTTDPIKGFLERPRGYER